MRVHERDDPHRVAHLGGGQPALGRGGGEQAAQRPGHRSGLDHRLRWLDLGWGVPQVGAVITEPAADGAHDQRERQHDQPGRAGQVVGAEQGEVVEGEGLRGGDHDIAHRRRHHVEGGGIKVVGAAVEHRLRGVGQPNRVRLRHPGPAEQDIPGEFVDHGISDLATVGAGLGAQVLAPHVHPRHDLGHLPPARDLGPTQMRGGVDPRGAGRAGRTGRGPLPAAAELRRPCRGPGLRAGAAGLSVCAGVVRRRRFFFVPPTSGPLPDDPDARCGP